jgi:hypothetical protein
MTQRVTPKQGRAIVRNYDWVFFFIILFPLNKETAEAESEIEWWVRRESANWCGDEDEDGTQRKPSYIVLGTRADRIQGPAFYGLVAGARDDFQLSVKAWNKVRGQMCTCIRFQDFKEKAGRRRKGAIRFLGELFDRNCLTAFQLQEQDRLPDE